MRRTRSACCARAASGYAAAPPSTPRNSRRLMRPTQPAESETIPLWKDLLGATSQCPLWVKSGHETMPLSMSALPPKADISRQPSVCPLCARSGHMQRSKLHRYSTAWSARASSLGGTRCCTFGCRRSTRQQPTKSGSCAGCGAHRLRDLEVACLESQTKKVNPELHHVNSSASLPHVAHVQHQAKFWHLPNCDLAPRSTVEEL